MWRRCLIANPGVPLSMIENNLRITMPGGTPNSRLCSLQLSSYSQWRNPLPNTDRSYRRQCPQCAQQLYHSDIYILPWLSRCPLHHCEFTKTCPLCSRSWPDRQDMAKRECTGCGRYCLDKPGKTLLSDIRKQDFQSIADIYDFISYEHHNCCIHDNDPVGWASDTYRWWHFGSFNITLPPALLAILHPEFSPSKLERLHIEVSPLQHNSTRLLPRSERNSDWDMRLLRSSCHDEVRLKLTRITEDITILNDH